MSEPVEPSTKDHWYMEVKCEHGYPVTVEVTPVWVFLPFRDTCQEAEERAQRAS